jgi:hypothetical protein
MAGPLTLAIQVSQKAQMILISAWVQYAVHWVIG